MRKMYFVLPMVLALFVFVACQKEGDTGPAGPAGPAGETGATGATGATGTANVIYSDWLDVIFELDEDSTYQAYIPASALTTEVLSNGDMKVYINFNTADDPVVLPLPYLLNGYVITPVFAKDTIFIAANVDASTYVDGGDKILQYRYVIIPGGEQAYKGVDFNNYLEVKEKFKLKN